MTKDEHLRELIGGDYEEFLAFRDTKWVGPYTIDQLLDNCLNDAFPKPPESDSIYLVSAKSWKSRPSQDCSPLYVGSTTGRSRRFRTRIGDLIADMFGFFQPETGHSSGGQSLNGYCKRNNSNPKQLYIAWLAECRCIRCAELYFWEFLEPQLNFNRPPTCKQHFGKERYLSIIPQPSRGSDI